MKRLAIVFALLAIGAGAASAEQFYKWKDANGAWHYTATPPPSGVESSKVSVSSGRVKERTEAELDVDFRTPGAASVASAPPTDGAPTAAPGDAPPVDPRAASEIAKRRATACDNARKRYDVLANNAAVEWDRDGDGIAEALDVEAHTTELAKAQQDIGFYCKRG